MFKGRWRFLLHQESNDAFIPADQDSSSAREVYDWEKHIDLDRRPGARRKFVIRGGNIVEVGGAPKRETR